MTVTKYILLSSLLIYRMTQRSCRVVPPLLPPQQMDQAGKSNLLWIYAYFEHLNHFEFESKEQVRIYGYNSTYCLKACANPITVTRIFPISQWGLHYCNYFKKTPLRNENSPITDPITKIGVAHALQHYAQSEGTTCRYIQQGHRNV